MLPPDVPPALREAMRRRSGSNGLCLFAADADHGRLAAGGFGCYGTADLLAGRAAAGLGDRVYGLVPDGVDHLEISLPGRPPRTVAVAENFYIYTGSLGRGDIRWLDASGNVLRTIPGASDLGPGPPARPDPAKSLCDPAVPRDQCPSGRYAKPSREP